MLLVESQTEAVRRQLERILTSPGFVRNERLCRFLRFIVERHLEGKDHELKEPVIAVEVFGRRPDYNPKHDPIVRTEAGRLRARLSEYYVGEGSSDALVIEVPKGGYVPAFRESPTVPATVDESPKVRSSRLWLTLAVAGLAVAVAAMSWWRLTREGPPVVIAVLPLENLSHDPADDYFADGLTDEIISNLSAIEGLAVRSRTSSFALKGTSLNVREAAKQLDAEYILECSVLRVGEQLRINAQLIRVRDDFALWSGKFDRQLTDIFAIQEEISRGITNGLRLKLGGGRRRYETSIEAYDLYLRARAAQRGLVDYKGSFDLFEKAIAKDPAFAPAYAGLAEAYAAHTAMGFNSVGRFDDLTKMRAAAEKAIQLDPLLPEAHDALGMAYSRDGQWRQSEKSFRRAIELNPGRSTSYAHFVLYLLWPLGKVEEALQQLRTAIKTDPLSIEVRDTLGLVLISAGRFDEAAGECQKLPVDNPQKNQCLGRARLGQGRIDEAIQFLAASSAPLDKAFLGNAYARAGRREEAEKMAAALSPNAFNQALIFAGLGDKDRTLEALDRMVVLGPFRIGRALTFPELAFLRGDPAVKKLRKKVGLPE